MSATRPLPCERERGSVTLQMVIMFPAVLLVLALVTQACLWFLARDAALSSAQEGVRAARTHQASPSAAREAALAFARTTGQGFLNQPTATVNATATDIEVRVEGSVPSFVPTLRLSISQTARGAREQFTTPQERP
ncbi:pilus assembly protein [Nonomuraea sp. NBC_00507]|uniref:TadE/TadG family type IV pilus assembly protein n=1 Tax=Nonomuraea sp. NBC_00507 TaxID=2976002 RepID=UPI002E18EDF1